MFFHFIQLVLPSEKRPVKSDDQILQEELQKLEVQESEVKSADTWDKFCLLKRKNWWQNGGGETPW